MKHTWYDPAAWFITGGTDEDSADSGTSGYRKAIEICWLVVIFLIPVFFNPLGHHQFDFVKTLLLQVLVITMFGLWLANRIKCQSYHQHIKWKALIDSPLKISILIFGLMFIISTAASITPEISFWGTWQRGSGGLSTLLCWITFFFILTHQVRSHNQSMRILYTLLLTSAVVSVVGILQHYVPAVSTLFGWSATTRVFATIGNPLFLSNFLAMTIPLNLALQIYAFRQRGKRSPGNNTLSVASSVLLAIQFWCLLLAQYSVTVLAFIIGAVSFIALLGFVEKRKPLLITGSAILIIITVMAAVVVGPALITANNETSPGDDSSVPISDEMGLTTIKYRAEYWRAAADIVYRTPEVPFTENSPATVRRLIGYGPETFILVAQQYPFQETINHYISQRTGALILDRPHNHYLYLATTVGVLGLAAFIAIMAIYFRNMFRFLGQATRDNERLIIIALIAAMVQYTINNIFNPVSITTELFFWLLLGLTPLVGRMVSKNQQQSVAYNGEKIPHQQNSTDIGIRVKYSGVIAIVSLALLVFIAAGVTVRPFLADMEFQKAKKFEQVNSELTIFAYNQTVRLEPRYPEYWSNMGAYIFNNAVAAPTDTVRERLVDFSIETYEQALAREPYLAFRNYSMADMYCYRAYCGSADKWARALELYDRAARLCPWNPVILNKWALALIIKGDLYAARNKLEQSAMTYPEWVETDFLAGLLILEEGENDAAADSLVTIIEQHPESLKKLSDTCFTLYLYDLVVPVHNSVQEYKRNHPREWAPHAIQGITCFFSGHPEHSIVEFDTAMYLVPEDEAGSIFGVALDLAGKSPHFKALLAGSAPAWRTKLSGIPGADRWLKALDKLAEAGL
ncbi:MAG: O-antigen ligase family protein [Dehalococcoidales bacterium]|nr:O-antigen ligase family protein [Dehalococcoidales bacterium]